MNIVRNHVISLVSDNTGEERFLCLEPDAGYVMSASTLSYAIFFTLEEAETQIKELLNDKPFTFSDGTIMPPHFIWSGLRISNANPKASGVLSIKRVELVQLMPTNVKGEIIHPTGFTYS